MKVSAELANALNQWDIAMDEVNRARRLFMEASEKLEQRRSILADTRVVIFDEIDGDCDNLVVKEGGVFYSITKNSKLFPRKTDELSVQVTKIKVNEYVKS